MLTVWQLNVAPVVTTSKTTLFVTLIQDNLRQPAPEMYNIIDIQFPTLLSLLLSIQFPVIISRPFTAIHIITRFKLQILVHKDMDNFLLCFCNI